MKNEKQDRILALFLRALRGEALSVSKLAREYGVSGKSISRDISALKSFLADHRMLAGNADLVYDYQSRSYRLYLEEFLTGQELFALVEVMIGSRAFSRKELLEMVEKLKRFTTTKDRSLLQALIRKEMYHYPEVHHDCERVTETLWRLARCIQERKEISIDYYRMDRARMTHRLRPLSLLFTDFYFYLIAFRTDDESRRPLYFRVDRITRMTEHRTAESAPQDANFDEGLLRRRSLYMWPGELRTIRFLFTGPSVQAVLDKLPTAKIIEKRPNGAYLIEAEVYGDGIRMFLLSQGSWVKVLSPPKFVEEMKKEIEAIQNLYYDDGEEEE